MEQVAATQQVFHGPLARLVDSEAHWAQMSNQQTVWREKVEDNYLEAGHVSGGGAVHCG